MWLVKFKEVAVNCCNILNDCNSLLFFTKRRTTAGMHWIQGLAFITANYGIQNLFFKHGSKLCSTYFDGKQFKLDLRPSFYKRAELDMRSTKLYSRCPFFVYKNSKSYSSSNSNPQAATNSHNAEGTSRSGQALPFGSTSSISSSSSNRSWADTVKGIPIPMAPRSVEDLSVVKAALGLQVGLALFLGLKPLQWGSE